MTPFNLFRFIATILGFSGIALTIHGIWLIHPIAGELTAAAWCCLGAYQLSRQK